MDLNSTSSQRVETDVLGFLMGEPTIKIDKINGGSPYLFTRNEFSDWVKESFKCFQHQPVMRTTRKGHRGLQKSLEKVQKASELSSTLRSVGIRVSGFYPEPPTKDRINKIFDKLSNQQTEV